MQHFPHDQDVELVVVMNFIRYPNGKGYVHMFHIWIVCYTPHDAARPRPV